MSSSTFSPAWTELARRYAAVEERVRRSVEALTSRVCPRCPSPCCRACYCRESALNPWYSFVGTVAGRFRPPPDWRTRRHPFGLGAEGCEIRAGRYVFCSSYTCRRLREALPEKSRREAFQELSDLLLPANRLPGGLLLHELRDPAALDYRARRHLDEALAEARRRLPRLAAEAGLLPEVDATARRRLPQATGAHNQDTL